MRSYEEIVQADQRADERSGHTEEDIDSFFEAHELDPLAVAMIARDKALAGVTDIERNGDLAGTLASAFLIGLSLGLQLEEDLLRGRLP